MKKPKMFWDDLDKQREMFAPSVPAGVGFTLNEYREHYRIGNKKLGEGKAIAELQALLNAGKIEVLGVREGVSGAPKVYNVKK